MNNKVKEFLINNDLPLPETIIYPPLYKVNGSKVIRYEIDSDGMFAIVDIENLGNIEVRYSLEQIKQYTWRLIWTKNTLLKEHST